MTATAFLFAVTIDCPDPAGLARFYRAFLGGELSFSSNDASRIKQHSEPVASRLGGTGAAARPYGVPKRVACGGVERRRLDPIQRIRQSLGAPETGLPP